MCFIDFIIVQNYVLKCVYADEKHIFSNKRISEFGPNIFTFKHILFEHLSIESLLVVSYLMVPERIIKTTSGNLHHKRWSLDKLHYYLNTFSKVIFLAEFILRKNIKVTPNTRLLVMYQVWSLRNLEPSLITKCPKFGQEIYYKTQQWQVNWYESIYSYIRFWNILL